ncbi:FkbM family methyltransferase [Aestuariirhabdus sp. LZHN29]|uniref:FkbM family methyltransferase n=1 Tax=Aestuariirhabdus sp. LZHN29 TaxID=3417462 RepID=UPI003CF762B4
MSKLRLIVKKLKKLRYGRDYVLARHQGLRFMLRASNHVDRKLLGGGRYEAEQISKVIGIINQRKVDLFVDIGANIGVYSIRIAKACPGLEKVVAIEAQIENYNQLCANIRLNDLDRRVDARHVGASDKAGVVEFLINKGSSTGTSRIKDTAPKDTKARKFNLDMVKVDTIDNLLQAVEGRSIFFKIDVEGHERNVLLGMKKVLQKNHCFFQIEILDSNPQRVTEGLGLKPIDQVGGDLYFESFPEPS